jgi:hypothetical protein
MQQLRLFGSSIGCAPGAEEVPEQEGEQAFEAFLALDFDYPFTASWAKSWSTSKCSSTSWRWMLLWLWLSLFRQRLHMWVSRQQDCAVWHVHLYTIEDGEDFERSHWACVMRQNWWGNWWDFVIEGMTQSSMRYDNLIEWRSQRWWSKAPSEWILAFTTSLLHWLSPVTHEWPHHGGLSLQSQSITQAKTGRMQLELHWSRGGVSQTDERRNCSMTYMI